MCEQELGGGRLMESRTIFFSGPKGQRWVTAPVPTLEKPSTSTAPPRDEKAQHRRTFFAALNALRPRLARYGLSTMEIRRYYAKRFSVERMSQCTQPQWAVAAAEVQAMVQSKEIFLERVGRFRRT